MRETLFDYCQRTGKTELLRQWSPVENGGLTPRDLSHGSHKRVWWQCDKGHRWQTAVYTRTGPGSGCPVCAGRQVLPGVNDLATRRPDLAAQWDLAPNGGLTPAQVPLGSKRKVWWVCDQGHRWQAMVKARVAGTGCPVCANRRLDPGRNDLAATHPALAAQWHPTKNGDLHPWDLMAGAKRRVWWRCEKGHQWQATVTSRASGAGCPVCAGRVVAPGETDLATRFPALAAQWHAEKNGTLTPDSLSPCSNRKVWWRCSLGHEYAATVAARTMNGTGCPYCAGRKVLPGFNDLATLEPEVAQQWHPTLNGTLTPEMVTAGSHRKVWWQCREDHVWRAVVYARAGPQKSGCPVCAGRSRAQRQDRYRTIQEKSIAAQAALK